MLFLVHGALWLSIRVSGALYDRGMMASGKLWFGLLVIAVVFLIATWFSTPLYGNYLSHPALFVVPVICVLSLLAVKFFIVQKNAFKAWLASALTIVSAVFFCIIGLFPNMLPSNMDAAYSLTAHNASASQLSLNIMLVVVLIFIPMVIGYQLWAYHLFSDKLGAHDLLEEEAY
jgi:cytochrome d ubiquinol oxidase subunit II